MRKKQVSNNLIHEQRRITRWGRSWAFQLINQTRIISPSCHLRSIRYLVQNPPGYNLTHCWTLDHSSITKCSQTKTVIKYVQVCHFHDWWYGWIFRIQQIIKALGLIWQSFNGVRFWKKLRIKAGCLLWFGNICLKNTSYSFKSNIRLAVRFGRIKQNSKGYRKIENLRSLQRQRNSFNWKDNKSPWRIIQLCSICGILVFFPPTQIR